MNSMAQNHLHIWDYKLRLQPKHSQFDLDMNIGYSSHSDATHNFIEFSKQLNSRQIFEKSCKHFVIQIQFIC